MKLRNHPNTASIYRWASEYTAESIFRELSREEHIEDFYETEEFKRIMFKVLNQRRALIGILGLQGSGKTRTLRELERLLWKKVEREKESVYYIKWSKDVFERMEEWESVCHRYNEMVKTKVEVDLEEYSRMHKRHPKLGRIPTPDDLYNVEQGYFDIELFLSKGELKESMNTAIYRELATARYVLVDLPDYMKSTAHSMDRDIDCVQALWQRLQADRQDAKTSFVIAFQKEMVMKHPHFFIGKLDVVTLKPLKPEQLIQAYKLRNVTIEPFAEDALRLLGELSRGIFRRFLKYIQITIEKSLEEDIPISPQHVSDAITEDLLIEDMELELSDIFKQKDKKAEAVHILNFIRQKGECNMQTIAEELDLGNGVVQRLVQKLHGYRYVDIRRGKGKEKLVSLTL